MDVLYIGDIPQEYHFAVFGSNYIDLYNTPNLIGTLNYYRVYLYENAFYYDFRQTTYNQYYSSTAAEIKVTNDKMYRRDFPSIMFMSVIFIMIIILLFNMVSSVFKKGGVFSGLL